MVNQVSGGDEINDSPISQRVSEHDNIECTDGFMEDAKEQRRKLKNQQLKQIHQEKRNHMELYNDESAFAHMEIFKDVVGLTREELEKVKEGKKLKKIAKN